MSFSDEEEDQLIEIITNYPVLYDARHENYRNILIKENVWKSIGEELKKNSEECKTKWKFIRDGYNRFKKTHKLGTAFAAPRNSKYMRHQQLTFLDGVSQHRSGGPNIASLEEYDEQTRDNEGNDESNNEKKNKDEESETNSGNPRETKNNRASKSQIKTRSKIISRSQRKNEDKTLKLCKEIYEKRRSLFKSISKRKDDNVELFCRHIGEVLRNLPPLEKAEAKKHLSIVLSDYEIKAARQVPQNYSSSPDSQTSSRS